MDRQRQKGPQKVLAGKLFSQGSWAAAAQIEAARQKLDAEQSTDAYAKRKASDAARRENKQAEYVEDFHGAVIAFLAFAPEHASLTKYRSGQAVAADSCSLQRALVAKGD